MELMQVVPSRPSLPGQRRDGQLRAWVGGKGEVKKEVEVERREGVNEHGKKVEG